MHILTETVVEPHEVMTHRTRSGLRGRGVGEGLYDRERREVNHTRVVVRHHRIGAVVGQLDVTRRTRRDRRVERTRGEVDETHLVQLRSDRVALVLCDTHALPEEVRARVIRALDRLGHEVDHRELSHVELVPDDRERAVLRDVDGRRIAGDGETRRQRSRGDVIEHGRVGRAVDQKESRTIRRQAQLRRDVAEDPHLRGEEGAEGTLGDRRDARHLSERRDVDDRDRGVGGHGVVDDTHSDEVVVRRADLDPVWLRTRDRDLSEDRAGRDVDHAHRVREGVGDHRVLTVRQDGDVHGEHPDVDRVRDHRRPEVEEGDRVRVAVADEHLRAVRHEGELTWHVTLRRRVHREEVHRGQESQLGLRLQRRLQRELTDAVEGREDPDDGLELALRRGMDRLPRGTLEAGGGEREDCEKERSVCHLVRGGRVLRSL